MSTRDPDDAAPRTPPTHPTKKEVETTSTRPYTETGPGTPDDENPPRGLLGRRAVNAGRTAEAAGVADALATFMAAKTRIFQPVGLLSFYDDRVEFLRTRRSFRARPGGRPETFPNGSVADLTVRSSRGLWTGGVAGAVIEFRCDGRRHRFVAMDESTVAGAAQDIRRTGLPVTERRPR